MKTWEAPLSANAVDTVRWRWPDDMPYPCPSVTSALGIIIPDGLKKWFINTDGAIVRRVSKTAADRGTRAHELLELICGKREIAVPSEFANITKAFKEFLSTVRPEFLHLEKEIIHRLYGFSGRADAIVRVGDRVELWDWKTGRITTETGWQLGGYILGLRSMGIHIDGMKAIKVDLKLNKIEVYEYEHIDFCIAKFLKALDDFRGLYFNNLMRGISVPDQKEKAKIPLSLLTFDTAYHFVDNLPPERKEKYLASVEEVKALIDNQKE